jgi:hypothetical protein
MSEWKKEAFAELCHLQRNLERAPHSTVFHVKDGATVHLKVILVDCLGGIKELGDMIEAAEDK